MLYNQVESLPGTGRDTFLFMDMYVLEVTSYLTDNVCFHEVLILRNDDDRSYQRINFHRDTEYGLKRLVGFLKEDINYDGLMWFSNSTKKTEFVKRLKPFEGQMISNLKAIAKAIKFPPKPKRVYPFRVTATQFKSGDQEITLFLPYGKKTYDVFVVLGKYSADNLYYDDTKSGVHWYKYYSGRGSFECVINDEIVSWNAYFPTLSEWLEIQGVNDDIISAILKKIKSRKPGFPDEDLCLATVAK